LFGAVGQLAPRQGCGDILRGLSGAPEFKNGPAPSQGKDLSALETAWKEPAAVASREAPFLMDRSGLRAGRLLALGASSGRIGLRTNDVVCVELVPALHALHDRAIWNVGPLRLICDIWLPAIVRPSHGETQRDQAVATTARTCSQSPFIVPSKRAPFRTVAYTEHATEPRDHDQLTPAASPAGPTAVRKRRIIRVSTLDTEATPMTDQPGPHDQHDSELQLVLTIGIEGFRELVAWVAEGATAADRHARGSQVRLVIDDLVKNGDSAKINQALLDEAERLRKEAQQ
jgi:hypothetical protein